MKASMNVPLFYIFISLSHFTWSYSLFEFICRLRCNTSDVL